MSHAGDGQRVGDHPVRRHWCPPNPIRRSPTATAPRCRSAAGWSRDRAGDGPHAGRGAERPTSVPGHQRRGPGGRWSHPDIGKRHHQRERVGGLVGASNDLAAASMVFADGPHPAEICPGPPVPWVTAGRRVRRTVGRAALLRHDEGVARRRPAPRSPAPIRATCSPARIRGALPVGPRRRGDRRPGAGRLSDGRASAAGPGPAVQVLGQTPRATSTRRHGHAVRQPRAVSRRRKVISSTCCGGGRWR